MILRVCPKNGKPYLPRIFRLLICLILVRFLKFKVLQKAETDLFIHRTIQELMIKTEFRKNPEK